MYIPFTDYVNQYQKKQTVTSERTESDYQTFMLNTKTTTVPALSGHRFDTLKVADTYSLSDTNKNPFQTNTD